MTLRVPRRYTHFLFGIIQSGLTCFVASGIGSLPLLEEGEFLESWLIAWLVAWATMLPIVILAAPLIRRIVERLVA